MIERGTDSERERERERKRKQKDMNNIDKNYTSLHILQIIIIK